MPDVRISWLTNTGEFHAMRQPAEVEAFVTCLRLLGFEPTVTGIDLSPVSA